MKFSLLHFTNTVILGAMLALVISGFTRLEQLTKVTDAELARLHGMGPNALARLRQALKEKGRAFARERPKRK